MTPHPFFSIKNEFHRYRPRSLERVIKLRKGEGGVTMIELVVSTAIIGLFIVLVMTFLADKYSENALANARSNFQLQSQLTLDLLNRDLKHAANVDSQNRWADPNSPTSPGDDYGWQSDADTLILAVPAVNSTNTVLYEDPNTYVSYKDNYAYFLNNGSLYRRTIAAEVPSNANTTTCPYNQSGCLNDSNLAQHVSNLRFQYYDANDQQVSAANARSVKVTLKVSRSLYGKTIELEQSIRTVLRND